MKLRRPDRIAICFVDGNKERTLEQVKQLEGIEDDFIVEWNFRADKFSGSYSTFSQLVNEAVVETSSEFMVFINPKTNISRVDVNRLIDDLCNGFAWSSICSFGFWATTKELFRHIGLMDERFIGSEWEDNDFAVRMKQFGKAINWRFELKKYPWSQPILPQMRGSTATLYPTKWHIVDGVYYRTDQFKEEKRLPKIIKDQGRSDIFNSWMDWNATQSDRVSHVFHEAANAIVSDEIVKTSKIKAITSLRIEYINGSVKFIFSSEIPTTLRVTITNGTPIGKERLVYNQNIDLEANTWWGNKMAPATYDIRVFHEGKLVLNNMAYIPNRNPILNYNLGLNVTQFSDDI